MIDIRRSFFNYKGLWLKGNVHSHTTRTDGLCPPQKQIDDYRSHGYDFLSITDHNVIDNHNLDAGENFILIPGWERDILYSPSKCIHLVGLCSLPAEKQEVLEMPRYTPGEITAQQLIDEMKAAGQYVILAHPIWSRMEPEEVSALVNFDAIEVFNTGCERLCRAGHAEVYWDMLLRKGRRVNAIACDDTHQKARKSDRFAGWVMVQAESRTHEDILHALYTGNYYSSMGPEIYDWGLDGQYLYIRCSPCKEVHAITWPLRGVSYYQEDKPITYLTHPLNDGIQYFRMECVGHNGNVAWTNTIFTEDI